jgi:hypothetical protein
VTATLDLALAASGLEQIISAAVRFRSGLPWIPLCSRCRPCVVDFFNSLLEGRCGFTAESNRVAPFHIGALWDFVVVEPSRNKRNGLRFM